jgi:hypothetical protein
MRVIVNVSGQRLITGLTPWKTNGYYWQKEKVYSKVGCIQDQLPTAKVKK